MTTRHIQASALSVEEYLAGECDAETRHEYVDGEVYAMTGASRRHVLIVTAMTIALGPVARQQACQVFTNDMKLRVELAGSTAFYYPDLMIACDAQDDADPYYLTRPCLVAEVLSPSTERIDRREKLLSYISVPSVQEILLIAQDRPLIEIHRRRSDWCTELYDSGNLHLDCLDSELAVEQVYRDVAGMPA